MMRGVSLFLISLIALSGAVAFGSGGAPKTSYSLVVLPSSYTAVQFGHDLVEREKVLLITYQPGSVVGNANLNAWTGTRWAKIPDVRFQDGSFVRSNPDRVIVVGGANDLTTSLITDASTWSPEVLNIESAETASLVNAMGRFMDFSDRDWEWYAARYELRLEDVNQEQRSRSWYDQNSPATIRQAPAPQIMEEPIGADILSVEAPVAPARESSRSSTPESFSFDSF